MDNPVIRITQSGADRLAKRYARAAKSLPDVIEKNMRALGIIVAAKERKVLEVVKYRGTLAGSVNSEYTATPPNFQVVIGPNAKHARIVRTGTRPHWVPLAPLKEWARWKLGDENAAYAVQRSIALYGTSHYLAKRGIPGAEQTQYGIGYDYPGQTLKDANVQQGIARRSALIGMEIRASLSGGETQ